MKRISKLDDGFLNLDVLEPYTGRTCLDTLTDFSIEPRQASKNSIKQFVDTMLRESDIVLGERYIAKTIRMVKPLRTKESMSLRVSDYCSMIDQTWDTSDFKKELSHTYVFFVFEGPASIETTLFRGTIIHNFTREEMQEAERVWTDTVSKIRYNDYDSFLTEKETGTFFFKIHAATTSDVMPTPCGGESVKRSFWIAKKFIDSRILTRL